MILMLKNIFKISRIIHLWFDQVMVTEKQVLV